MRKLDVLLNISNIILDASSHQNALMEIVAYLKKVLECDVCSIYLLNRMNDEQLCLVATDGLHRDAIGKVTMRCDEGLTGRCYSTNSYTFIRNASKHEGFKYFPGIGEEPFKTFIGIPLKNKAHTFGVLVLQFHQNKNVSPIREKFLLAVAAQLSGMVLQHYLMEDASAPELEYMGREIVLKGIPLSAGITMGSPVRVIFRYIESDLAAIDVREECQKLTAAFRKTATDLKALSRKLEKSGSAFESEIFHTHLMILEDPRLQSDIERHILDFTKSAAFSVRHVIDKYIDKFRAIADPYLRERAADMEDISQRLMCHLGVVSRQTEIKEDSIILADRLTPGETAALDLEKVNAFVTHVDGVTSHTAILAKNRGIPAVTGIEKIFDITEFAEWMIVDGFDGTVIINPTEETILRYQARITEKQATRQKKIKIIEEPIRIGSETISFDANVSSVLDAEKAAQFKASGIGLVRTEIFYLQNDGNFPYQEQLETYQRIIHTFPDLSIVFRLFDIGSDKKSSREAREDNPALGFRGARLLIDDQSFFLDQVRALLEVCDPARHKLLIPFIADAHEFNSLRLTILQEAARKGKAAPAIGVMVEIPSAVFQIAELAQKADFISVGTNDLFQYFFALDRANPRVSNLYSPNSPAFLELLQQVLLACRAAHTPVEICGEIASDHTILLKLIEMGYRHFSVNPYVINELRAFLLQELQKSEWIL
ncbi:phosphoenolpyruvate--protein phosphotransferase [Chrysiogenes arsenatis]|uniref:phosphoenolpyruvate--protein phosphotransferase n=1 Tax=Chrysiogenes arsenatis TaxID=309797 RepID=UPI00041A2651|nr:phosphoenolpyruvate--protein phosphotransferase [Chrysiogenes arsenatis]